MEYEEFLEYCNSNLDSQTAGRLAELTFDMGGVNSLIDFLQSAN